MKTTFLFKTSNGSESFREYRETDREIAPAVGETIRLGTESGPADFTVTKIGRYRETEFYTTRTIYVKPTSPTCEVLPGLTFRPLETARPGYRCTICGNYLGSRHTAESMKAHFEIACKAKIPFFAINHAENRAILKALGLRSYREFRKRFRK